METIIGDGAIVTMSHAVAVLCIQVPTFETTPAIQIARKTLWRRGLQAECPLGPFPGGPESTCPELTEFIHSLVVVVPETPERQAEAACHKRE
jgi:hypothetical protein